MTTSARAGQGLAAWAEGELLSVETMESDDQKKKEVTVEKELQGMHEKKGQQQGNMPISSAKLEQNPVMPLRGQR